MVRFVVIAILLVVIYHHGTIWAIPSSKCIDLYSSDTSHRQVCQFHQIGMDLITIDCCDENENQNGDSRQLVVNVFNNQGLNHSINLLNRPSIRRNTPGLSFAYNASNRCSSIILGSTTTDLDESIEFLLLVEQSGRWKKVLKAEKSVNHYQLMAESTIGSDVSRHDSASNAQRLLDTCGSYVRGVCNEGYYQYITDYFQYVPSVNYWRCGASCAGGQYFTDGNCNCVCLTCGELLVPTTYPTSTTMKPSFVPSAYKYLLGRVYGPFYLSNSDPTSYTVKLFEYIQKNTSDNRFEYFGNFTSFDVYSVTFHVTGNVYCNDSSTARVSADVGLFCHSGEQSASVAQVDACLYQVSLYDSMFCGLPQPTFNWPTEIPAFVPSTHQFLIGRVYGPYPYTNRYNTYFTFQLFNSIRRSADPYTFAAIVGRINSYDALTNTFSFEGPGETCDGNGVTPSQERQGTITLSCGYPYLSVSEDSFCHYSMTLFDLSFCGLPSGPPVPIPTLVPTISPTFLNQSFVPSSHQFLIGRVCGPYATSPESAYKFELFTTIMYYYYGNFYELSRVFGFIQSYDESTRNFIFKHGPGPDENFYGTLGLYCGVSAVIVTRESCCSHTVKLYDTSFCGLPQPTTPTPTALPTISLSEIQPFVPSTHRFLIGRSYGPFSPFGPNLTSYTVILFENIHQYTIENGNEIFGAFTSFDANSISFHVTGNEYCDDNSTAITEADVGLLCGYGYQSVSVDQVSSCLYRVRMYDPSFCGIPQPNFNLPIMYPTAQPTEQPAAYSTEQPTTQPTQQPTSSQLVVPPKYNTLEGTAHITSAISLGGDSYYQFQIFFFSCIYRFVSEGNSIVDTTIVGCFNSYNPKSDVFYLDHNDECSSPSDISSQIKLACGDTSSMSGFGSCGELLTFTNPMFCDYKNAPFPYLFIIYGVGGFVALCCICMCFARQLKLQSAPTIVVSSAGEKQSDTARQITARYEPDRHYVPNSSVVVEMTPQSNCASTPERVGHIPPSYFGGQEVIDSASAPPVSAIPLSLTPSYLQVIGGDKNYAMDPIRQH